MSSPQHPNSDDRRTDLAVMDVAEYKQKRRLRRLLDAREKVEERLDDANERLAAGRLTTDERNLVVLEAVKEYIREAWNLLRDYDEEHFDDDGNLRNLDEYVDENGEPMSEEVPQDFCYGVYLGSIERRHAEDVHFHGLHDVLHADEVYEEVWTTSESRRHGADEVVEHSEVYTVPLEVSMQAYLTLNRFLASETNLDLVFDDESLPEDEL